MLRPAADGDTAGVRLKTVRRRRRSHSWAEPVAEPRGSQGGPTTLTLSAWFVFGEYPLMFGFYFVR